MSCVSPVWALSVLLLATSASCAPRPAPEAKAPATPATNRATNPATPIVLRPNNVATVTDPARLQRLLERNSDPVISLPETLLTERIQTWRALPVGARVARWAQLFATRTDNAYCFGPKPGGYVGDSLLVQDHKFDCVLLFYRCTELARAASARDAILVALSTRFAGGDPAHVVGPTGSVDYNDPAHLDYSEDFAATGLWGRDVTREIGAAVADADGTERYPAGSRYFIPTAAVAKARLQDGDLLFFVLNEKHDGARKLRQQYGLLIGHQGIVHRAGDTVNVIHAASSDLSGVYQGNRVVEVPLATYLQRVDRYKGIMVSRLDSDAIPVGRR
jgi:hypothetical protein